jgi:hypothetical protein
VCDEGSPNSCAPKAEHHMVLPTEDKFIAFGIAPAALHCRSSRGKAPLHLGAAGELTSLLRYKHPCTAIFLEKCCWPWGAH